MRCCCIRIICNLVCRCCPCTIISDRCITAKSCCQGFSFFMDLTTCHYVIRSRRNSAFCNIRQFCHCFFICISCFWSCCPIRRYKTCYHFVRCQTYWCRITCCRSFHLAMFIYISSFIELTVISFHQTFPCCICIHHSTRFTITESIHFRC